MHEYLKCPNFKCDAKPTEDEIKNIVKKDFYKKYLQF
jgi:hypothetical protein